jgi:hypothetical protein
MLPPFCEISNRHKQERTMIKRLLFSFASLLFVFINCLPQKPISDPDKMILENGFSRISEISFNVQGKVDSTFRFDYKAWQDCCGKNMVFAGMRDTCLNDTLVMKPYYRLLANPADSICDSLCQQPFSFYYKFSTKGKKYLLLYFRGTLDTMMYYDSIEIKDIVTDTTVKALSISDLPTHSSN